MLAGMNDHDACLVAQELVAKLNSALDQLAQRGLSCRIAVRVESPAGYRAPSQLDRPVQYVQVPHLKLEVARQEVISRGD